MNTNHIARAAAAALLLTGAGCAGVGLAVGAAATAGVSVAQERTTRQALTDAEIAVAINDALFKESTELFGDISTEVVEGRVLLTGSVPNPDDRVRAAEIVWSTPDVAELLNEITVGEDEGVRSYAEDVWITTQLEAKLLTDVDVSAINYNIETIDQTVHLIGVARTEEELVRVVEIARGVPGVKRVVSHVLTKTDERRVAG